MARTTRCVVFLCPTGQGEDGTEIYWLPDELPGVGDIFRFDDKTYQVTVREWDLARTQLIAYAHVRE